MPRCPDCGRPLGRRATCPTCDALAWWSAEQSSQFGHFGHPKKDVDVCHQAANAEQISQFGHPKKKTPAFADWWSAHGFRVPRCPGCGTDLPAERVCLWCLDRLIAAGERYEKRGSRCATH